MEKWKDVHGYEGIYEVSTLGNVRTCVGKTTESVRHGTRVWAVRILKQKTDKNGYKRVTLYKDKKPKTWLVHRLVTHAFLYKPEGMDLVNHINGKPYDNRVDNLEWCTPKMNIHHAFETGLMTTQKETILFDPITNEKRVFLSQSKASQFMGKNSGFVNGRISRNQLMTEKYFIVPSE